ncbi:hypothetical protein EDB83DRAFT_1448520 [Lactarius deliciosus]|nr:hypothetical protein EDB83DRAFT_1448520 [Lactarius deliciosus]
MIAPVLALFGMRSRSGAVLSRFPYHYPASVLTGTSSPSLTILYGRTMSITVLVTNAVILKVCHISQPHPVCRDSSQNSGGISWIV